MKAICFLLSLTLMLNACTTIDVFEQSKPFPNHQWKSSEMPSFIFEIKDTAAYYNLFVVLRHEDAYRYKNIWLNIQVKSPDSTLQIKREFILSNNTQWLGTTMSDIVEHRIAFNKTPARLIKGKYTFTLQQAMREDPLDYILNAGIRVEKVKP